MANPRVQDLGWGDERATDSEENNGWRLLGMNYVVRHCSRCLPCIIRLILSLTQERVVPWSSFTDETKAQQGQGWDASQASGSGACS